MPTTLPTPTLRSPDVVAAAGCTYRQLDYWCRQHILRPTVTDAAGSGSRREWHTDDITHARICTHLARLGATTPILASVVATLRAHPERLDNAWLTVTTTGAVVDTLLPHQAAWIVPLH